MFAKTVCKPGAYLCVVPVGLRTTLQYNSKGVLEKVLLGYEDEAVDISSELLKVVVSQKLVPISIPIKQGTTWVSGVFYTSSRSFYDEGILPTCIEKSMINWMKQYPEDFQFFAGNVDSRAASFKAIMTLRNWLSMSKFNVLPGHVIPAQLTEDAFVKLVMSSSLGKEFYPLFSGYMIFEAGNFRYHPLNLHQFIVSKVSKSTDESGYVKGLIYDESNQVRLVLHYSDVVRFNIQTASNIVYTESNKVLMSTNSTDGKKREPRSNKITCSICGKQLVVPSTGPVTCDDKHCLSLKYADVRHLLKTLDLPEISYDQYVKYIKQGDIIYIPDVLLLPEYEDVEIELTLSKLLHAATPVSVCMDSSVFTVVANRCSDSTKTLRYYLENPNRLKIDLNINSVLINRWIEWLEDPHNSRIIETLLDYEKLHIINSTQAFEGAPIFRDKHIAVTGRFLHGDLEEVMSILRSYSAQVSTDVDNKTQCLVIGSLKENIDGRCVKLAKDYNIPIFDENDFFNRYDIDSDLAKNLL